MSEQKKKWQRIYDLLHTKTKPKKISEIIGVFDPDLNPLDYTQWGVLENKTNATSHPNIGLPVFNGYKGILHILQSSRCRYTQDTHH